MNLVAAPATHVTTVASTIDAAALYQNQQQQQQVHQQTVAQQQPISYKIPQIGGVVVTHEQPAAATAIQVLYSLFGLCLFFLI